MLVSAIFIAGVALSSESKEKDARGKREIDKQQPAAVLALRLPQVVFP